MAVKDTKLPRFTAPTVKRGELPKVKKWRRQSQAIDTLSRGADLPRQNTARAFLQRAEVGYFLIITIDEDHFVCQEWSGIDADEETSVFVAKPPELRGTFAFNGRASPDGVSYVYSGDDFQTREATASDLSTETQVITPRYTAEVSFIFAIRGIRGGTGVRVLGETDDPDNLASGGIVEWLDLNVAARAFAKEA